MSVAAAAPIPPSPLAQADYIDLATSAIREGKNLPTVLLEACRRNADRPLFTNMGLPTPARTSSG
jgi:hypothetical protein